MTRVTRWHGGLVGAVVLAAAGVAVRSPALIVATTIPLAYVVVMARASAPDVAEAVAVDRRIESDATPGRRVRVELLVTNEHDRHLPDVRVVDRVPAGLVVSAGTPRGADALAPGESLTVSYAVTARRGAFAFETPRVRLRSLGGAARSTASVPVAGDTRLRCHLDAGDVPLRERAARHTGPLQTDSPGRGLEFHSTREYRRGDPVNRIDWTSLAKRDELTTVNFRERRAATAVLVVDAREPCRVVSAPGQPSAVELSAYAAMQALEYLQAGRHEIAVAILGVPGPGGDAITWIPPGTGADLRARALDAFDRATAVANETAMTPVATESATEKPTNAHEGTNEQPAVADGGDQGDQSDEDDEHWAAAAGVTRSLEDAEAAEAADGTDGTEETEGTDASEEGASGPAEGENADRPAPPAPEVQIEQLLARTPPYAQVLVFSPLVDDVPVTAVERLAARGLEPSLFSPDVIAANTTSGQIDQLRRRGRLARTQAAGVRTVDWRRQTPLAVALEYAFALDRGAR